MTFYFYVLAVTKDAPRGGKATRNVSVKIENYAEEGSEFQAASVGKYKGINSYMHSFTSIFLHRRARGRNNGSG